MASLLIHGGRVIDPVTGRDETANLLVQDGLVTSIESGDGSRSDRAEAPNSDLTRFNAEGLIVAPGLIDIHVHFREPDPRHRETIASGVAAAAAGGFTTVCCMPNTNPPLDSAAMVRFVQDRAAAARSTRVFVVGCASTGRKGEQLAEIAAMSQAGAVAFSDDGDVIADAGLMKKALQMVREQDACFMQHCQEPTLTRGAAMNAGPIAMRLGLTGWPAVAEELIIERDIRLNRDVGCRYHVQHISSGGSVDLVREARHRGEPITGEASPHHLLLTDTACDGYNTMAKMNPPLRTRADVDAIKAGIADGTITVLATDHAPHPPESKNTDFASASFGIVGLECALALYAKALIDDGVVDWPRLIAMMTSEPATLVGLDRHGLGRLSPGGPADITIIDPDHQWTIDPADFRSAGRNCPFGEWAATVRSVATVVGGRIVDLRVRDRLDGRLEGAGTRSATRPVTSV